VPRKAKELPREEQLGWQAQNEALNLKRFRHVPQPAAQVRAQRLLLLPPPLKKQSSIVARRTVAFKRKALEVYLQ